MFAMRAFTKSIFPKDVCAKRLATRRLGIGTLGLLLACSIATATMAAGADDVGTAQSIIRSQEQAPLLILGALERADNDDRNSPQPAVRL